MKSHLAEFNMKGCQATLRHKGRKALQGTLLQGSSIHSKHKHKVIANRTVSKHKEVVRKWGKQALGKEVSQCFLSRRYTGPAILMYVV